MSADAGNDLLKSVRAALIADTAVNAQVQGRVFSSWDNQNVSTPFIRLSLPITRQFEMDGGGLGSEADVSVHVFTTESAPIAARTLASRVRDAIDRQALALDGSDLVGIDYRDTIMRRDDVSPLLQMAVVRFVAMTTSK